MARCCGASLAAPFGCESSSLSLLPEIASRMCLRACGCTIGARNSELMNLYRQYWTNATHSVQHRPRLLIIVAAFKFLKHSRNPCLSLPLWHPSLSHRPRFFFFGMWALVRTGRVLASLFFLGVELAHRFGGPCRSGMPALPAAASILACRRLRRAAASRAER